MLHYLWSFFPCPLGSTQVYKTADKGGVGGNHKTITSFQELLQDQLCWANRKRKILIFWKETGDDHLQEEHTAVLFKVASQPAGLALQTEKHQTNENRHTLPKELSKAWKEQQRSRDSTTAAGLEPSPLTRCCCTQSSAPYLEPLQGLGWHRTNPQDHSDGVFVQVVQELCKCCIHTCKRDGQTKAEAHYRLSGTPLVLWHRWTVFNIQLDLERCFIFLILCNVSDDQALFFLHYNKRLHWTVLGSVHYICYNPLNWTSQSGWGKKGPEFTQGASHGWQHHADPS